MLPVDDDEALILLGAIMPPLPEPESDRVTLDGGNGSLVVEDEYVGIAVGWKLVDTDATGSCFVISRDDSGTSGGGG